jgi:integrase
MPYLTDDLARELPAPASGQKVHWDSDADGRPESATSGFGLRITAGNARAWILSYRTDDGSQRRFKIGRFPKVKAELARKRAQELAAEIALGADPQGKRSDDRKAARVNDLIERFDREHISKRKASTRDGYRRLIKLHVQPAIGHMKVRDVAYADIEALHRKLTKAGHRYQANRVVAVTSKMFTLAQRWQMRTDGINPCRNVERHREQARRRYLTTDELSRLLAALAKHPDLRSANTIRLLILSGARRGEVLGMKWRDLDLSEGT